MDYQVSQCWSTGFNQPPGVPLCSRNPVPVYFVLTSISLSLLFRVNKKAVPSCLVKTSQKCQAFPFCQLCTTLAISTKNFQV